MSVLQHGGSFLQRRLTKMYSDTKSSCESVTTSTLSRGADDPEFLALKGSIRTQTDRLLAWGLDWSDSNAAQPNDIDESLTQAGFSDVVESVMSSIQDHLNEADRLLKSSPSDSPSKRSLSGMGTRWTTEDTRRSKALVSDLTACIDTLYDLSLSRRSMTAASMSSDGQQLAAKGQLQPTPPPRPLKIPKDFDDSSGSRHGINQRSQGKSENSPFLNLRVSPQVAPHSKHDVEGPFSDHFTSTKRYLIDRSALQLSGASHDMSLPPYEMVAASSNSRVVGRMRPSASPLLSSTREPTVSILVEFTPMLLETQNAITTPATQRLGKVNQSLDQLIQNARVSHLGLLRFLGYYIDMSNARYAFVYQMPMDYFPFLRNPTDLLNEWKPKPLASFFQSVDRQDVPNLETRYRLAYDLLLAVLHLRSQNIVHGNINSSNIIIFPGLADSHSNEVRLTEDFRRPYLTSLAQFSGDGPSPEPLSSSMYRHPDDKRELDDESAWAYDLYSLGLVLLEIGLWLPISRCWKMKYNNTMFKQRIENLYVRRLAPKCGSAYFHMVQLCLDAPNFHLSTQPMDDLSLRLPQIHHYPVLDLSEPENFFCFSMNFLYTLCKIAWSCCRIDIFSAPPAEDLDDCLPLALVPGSEAAVPIKHSSQGPMFEQPDFTTQRSMEAPSEQMKDLKEKKNSEDRKIKKRTIRKLTDVDIPQENLNEWNFKLMPKLSKLLQKVLRESPESSSATLMMTGDSTETAKTTICVTCSNVKKVRSALKRYFELDKDGWELVVLRGDVHRSKDPRRKRCWPGRAEPEVGNAAGFAPSNFNPCFQQRPTCGASIGAFVNDEHLPPVSYGGTVLVDDVPYGMTVHHMLETPSDDEEPEDSEDDDPPYQPSRSTGNWPRNINPSDADLMYARCEENLPEAGLEIEVSDEDEDEHSVLQPHEDFWLSDDEAYSSDEDGVGEDAGFDSDEDGSSVGDTAGVFPGEEELRVTQPALDDIEDGYYPMLEDRDEEHLHCHRFAYVHSSSGVRRWTRKGIKHEIDWALLEVDNRRLQPHNVVLDKTRPAGPLNVSQPVCLNKVARMEELGGLQVHCCGRTSGFQGGQISKAMSLVKLQDRESFSSSFCVNGNFGFPGDSGAWVFDKSTGRVCGHVIAWSDKTHVTYIAPMEILLEHIARTLEASRVTLPASPESVPPFTPMSSHSYNPFSQYGRYLSQNRSIYPSPQAQAQAQAQAQTQIQNVGLGLGLEDNERRRALQQGSGVSRSMGGLENAWPAAASASTSTTAGTGAGPANTAGPSPSSTAYGSSMARLMAPTRGLERQLA